MVKARSGKPKRDAQCCDDEAVADLNAVRQLRMGLSDYSCRLSSLILDDDCPLPRYHQSFPSRSLRAREMAMDRSGRPSYSSRRSSWKSPPPTARGSCLGANTCNTPRRDERLEGVVRSTAAKRVWWLIAAWQQISRTTSTSGHDPSWRNLLICNTLQRHQILIRKFESATRMRQQEGSQEAFKPRIIARLSLALLLTSCREQRFFFYPLSCSAHPY